MSHELNIGEASALYEAVSAIYFDDSSDYKIALWNIVKALAPELVGPLADDPKPVFDKVRDLLPARRATVPAAQQAGTRIASADDLAEQDAAREAETARLAKQYVDRQAEAVSVRDAIFKALRSYHMANMNFSDEEGGGSYALVDLMTPDCKSIGEGEDEMQILADEIDTAIRALQGKPGTAKGGES